jgi:DNA-binding NtrC family response regulator
LSKTIFIVDDEESILKMLTHWCKNQWGYDVKTFVNGNDALNAISGNIDLVLLDIMLPDINGNEVLVKIKQKFPSLPVIMLSAQGSVEVALESIRWGAFDYFPKPIDKNRLEHAVRNAIKSFDLERELESIKENLKREYSFDKLFLQIKKCRKRLG